MYHMNDELSNSLASNDRLKRDWLLKLAQFIAVGMEKAWQHLNGKLNGESKGKYLESFPLFVKQLCLIIHKRIKVNFVSVIPHFLKTSIMKKREMTSTRRSNPRAALITFCFKLFVSVLYRRFVSKKDSVDSTNHWGFFNRQLNRQPPCSQSIELSSLSSNPTTHTEKVYWAFE